MGGSILFIKNESTEQLLSFFEKEENFHLSVVMNFESADPAAYDLVCVPEEEFLPPLCEKAFCLVLGKLQGAPSPRTIVLDTGVSRESFLSCARALLSLRTAEHEKAALLAENEKKSFMKESLLSGIIDAAPVGIMAFHSDVDLSTRTLRVAFLNSEFTRITGYTSKEMKTGMDWWTHAYPDEGYRLQRIALFREKLAQTGSGSQAVGPISTRIQCSDGASKDIIGYYLRHEDYSLFFLIDVSETEKIRRDLVDSQRKLEQILRFLPDPTFAVDLEGKVIFWNRAIEELTGIPAQNMIGKGDHEYSATFYGERRDMLIDFILNPESHTKAIYRALRREGDSVFAEFVRILPDGTKQNLWGKASPLYDTGGSVTGAMESIRDITQLRENESMLQQSEAKFRSIFESMPAGFFRTSPAGQIIEVNPAFLRIFGYSSREGLVAAIHDDVRELYADPVERELFLEQIWISLDREVAFTPKAKRSDGSVFPVSLTGKMVRDSGGKPMYIEGILEDASERELLQQVMVQSEKMMTVAGLAAGMAHEINNPLGIILQMAENAERRLLGGIPGNAAAAEKAGTSMEQIRTYVAARRVDAYLKGIREAGVRAARIVSNMLQFSRTSSDEKKPCNVELLLDRTVELVSNDYDLKKRYDFRQISIVREYRGIPRVMCVEIQLEQVFINMFKNAAHAMTEKKYPEGQKPSIRVSTDVDGADAVIELADNGPGIDDEVQKKIFEPFFTTKSPGSGTGLGLSVSYYIITAHGGTISVSSRKGEGASFTIRLPIPEEEVHEPDDSHP